MSLHISANNLAKFITAKTPERRKAIVRSLRRQKKGFAPWYSAFDTPAKAFLAGGATDPSIILRAIERMKIRTKTPWIAQDSLITADLFRSLLTLAPTLRGLGVKFTAPGGNLHADLHYPDLIVSVPPDMIVQGERNGVPLVGALRFYLAKESSYQLGHRGAELVAVMLHHWLTGTSTGTRTPDTSLCMVLECFQQRVTVASPDVTHHLALIERGARDFVELWHRLDHEEAA